MQRCLIIDGSAIIRKVTRVILADFGYETVEASTGKEGLAEFHKQSPNLVMPQLVMVDSHLTDMAALDVLRQIKIASAGGVYVLYCTTEYDLLDLQRAHAAGASDVLIKPFDRVSLAAKLDARAVEVATAGRPNFYTRLSQSDLKRIA